MQSPHAAPARIRLMGDSFLYTSPGIVSRACRHAVSLIFSAGHEPVEVQWREGCTRSRSLIVGPFVSRVLNALEVPFVLLDLEPSHPNFRHFALAPASASVQALDLPEARPLHQLALDFRDGALAGRALDARLRHSLQVLADAWFDPGPIDQRVTDMMRSIDSRACTSLEALAQAQSLSLSLTQASRLFSAQVGIPSRAYAVAAKVRAASRYMGSGRSLTEVALAAGFADSAHFAKVWLRSYGAPPSRYFPAQRTAVDAWGLRSH